MEDEVRDERRSRAVQEESGQVLVLAALGMTMMLVMVALVVDIGKAYLVQRQLQAAADAAALAGAQHLPDPTEATQVAEEYGPSTGGRNEVTTGSLVSTTVTMRCVASAPGCNAAYNAYNAVNVRASSDVKTVFAKILGIDKLTVRASATACSPCSAKPLDIMVVLDRTGSMCQFAPGHSDPACTDLNNAKTGIRTFLSFMDPNLDHVGLALFPPALDRSWVATCPYTPWQGNPSGPTPDGRYFGYDAYWPEWIPDPRGQTPSVYAVASLSSDYLVESSGSWVLNPSSALVQRLGCAGGAGSTSYALSIEEAQHELDRNGRGEVQDVIVFLSDGAANTSPPTLPTSHWANNPTNAARPCGTGVQSAQRVKDQGTLVYTIGYDLNGLGTDPERCLAAAANGHQGSTPESCGSWGCTAYDAIRAMASEPDNFYNKPNPGQLNTIFTRIAADLQRPAARLIDDDTP
jgi:hypothetical protein